MVILAGYNHYFIPSYSWNSPMFSSMHWITRRLEVAIHVREPHAILRGATDLGDLFCGHRCGHRWQESSSDLDGDEAWRYDQQTWDLDQE